MWRCVSRPRRSVARGYTCGWKWRQGVAIGAWRYKSAYLLDMVDFLGAVVGVCVFLGLLFLANLRRGDSSGSQWERWRLLSFFFFLFLFFKKGVLALDVDFLVFYLLFLLSRNQSVDPTRVESNPRYWNVFVSNSIWGEMGIALD